MLKTITFNREELLEALGLVAYEMFDPADDSLSMVIRLTPSCMADSVRENTTITISWEVEIDE